jgi:hypothetical protein
LFGYDLEYKLVVFKFQGLSIELIELVSLIGNTFFLKKALSEIKEEYKTSKELEDLGVNRNI